MYSRNFTQVILWVFLEITIDYLWLHISCELYWENSSFVGRIAKLRGPLKAFDTKLDYLPCLYQALIIACKVAERV